MQVIAEELTSNKAEAEAKSENDDDEGGASPIAAFQPSTLELSQALDALRCGLYAGKLTIAFTTMLRRLRTSSCLRRLREHSNHRSLNSSQISNVLLKKMYIDVQYMYCIALFIERSKCAECDSTITVLYTIGTGKGPFA